MCAFCDPEVKDGAVFSVGDFYAVHDRAPVTEGHLLLILERHEAEPFSLTAGEWVDYGAALEKAKRYLDEKYHPDGYNVGANIGEAAGQTVMHYHVHVIPRRKGDVANPHGGVRNLMKPLKELLPSD